MRASDFARQRARIIRRSRGRLEFYERAMAHLVREADARPVVVGGQVVAWAMSGGGWVCAKHRYMEQEAANDELANIQAHARGHKIPTRCYRCGYCGGWHLTSQALRAA